MITGKRFIKTYLPLHPNDSNEYTIIGRDATQVTASFSAQELFNPKTGLSEHPISLTIVRVAQAIRDYFGIPVRIENPANPIGRTYRNYPSSGANPSGHHLAQAIDLSFLVEKKIANELYLLCRDDFDKKGPLFQRLWDLGCRGFGSYDTFIHIDSVIPELYEGFAKRRSKHRGLRYGRWNNMKALKYLSPTAYGLLPENSVIEIKPLPTDFPTSVENNNSSIPTDIIPEKTIVETAKETAKKAIGSTIGLFTELMSRDVEDKYEDANQSNIGYMIAAIAFALLAFFLFIKMLKRLSS